MERKALENDLLIIVESEPSCDLLLAFEPTYTGLQAYALRSKWLRNNGLELAIQKTKAVLHTMRKKLETIRVEVDDHVIESASPSGILGVVIDARMTFQEHLNRASERSMKSIFALSRKMSNIVGPSDTKRKLLASVSSSIMLYGSIRANAANVPTHVVTIRSSYRISALKAACSYDAIYVISSMSSI